MHYKRLALLMLFAGTLAFAQNHGGLIPIEPQLYKALPKGVYSLRNTGKLPANVDLSSMVLTPLSQGIIGACTSWTVAYELTRLERTRNKWPISETNMFSASYLYNQVNRGIDRGSNFFENLTIAVNKGCSTYQTFPYTWNYLLQPDTRAHQEAAQYKILEWKVINRDVNSFKSWLAGGYGIICTFNMWDNFDQYKAGVYRPAGPEGVVRGDTRYYYHGCLIIGYDDNLRLFKVINSWGEYWGEKGYWYFDYEDICNLVYESYIVIPKTKVSPPSNIEASKGIYRDKIVISWKKLDSTTDYLIFRLEDDNYRLLGESSTNRFVDRTAKKGKKYFYYVVSKAGNTMSEYSTPIEGWIKEKAEPGIPQNVILAPLNTCVILSWDAVEDATHYEIYRWDETEAAFILVGRSETTIFRDQNLAGGNEQVISYIVVAVNQYGSSLPSSLAYGILDSSFQGRKRDNNYPFRKYNGDFYQFPTNRFFIIEQRVQDFFEKNHSRVESYFSTFEKSLNNYFEGKK